MRFIVSSILVALTSNMCSGFLFGSIAAPQACVINCNNNTPICARSVINGICKYYNSLCGMQANNCRSPQFAQTSLSECDGLLSGETGPCLPGGNGSGSGSGDGGSTGTANGNRRRNRNRRNGNRRNRRNRNRVG